MEYYLVVMIPTTTRVLGFKVASVLAWLPSLRAPSPLAICAEATERQRRVDREMHVGLHTGRGPSGQVGPP